MPPSRRAATSPSRRRPQARPSRSRDDARRAGSDLAARLTSCEEELQTRAARRDLFLEIFRRVNATFAPEEIAAITLEYLTNWIDAPIWAVATVDASAPPATLAERGVTPAMRSGMTELVAEAAATRTFAGFANLSEEEGLEPLEGSAIALPLVCGDRVVGAVVAVDPGPSARVPELRSAAETALSILIEPMAAALEKSVRLARAEALSVTDDLTKLYNSRYLNLALRREVKRAARNQLPVSLLFVDLDGFKLINDTYGHLTGSRALVEVAAVIRDSARETDVVARFGGDEFALILPDTNATGARAVAERLCQRVAAYRFVVDGERQVRLTASVGIATLPDAAGSPDGLMQAADLAMYRVKERGKNGIEAAPFLADT